MPRCPKCSRVYADGKLKFCTNDGARLVLADVSATAFEQNSAVAALSRRTPPGELLIETVIFARNAANQIAEAPVLSVNGKTFAAAVATDGNGSLHTTSKISETEISDFDIAAQATLHGNSKPEKISDPPAIAPLKKEPSKSEKELSNPKTAIAAANTAKTTLAKSGLPFVAVCVVGALLLFSALAFTAVYFSSNQTAEQRRAAIGNSAPSIAVAAVPAASAPTQPPQTFAPVKEAAPLLPAGFVEFENKKSILSGKLVDKFVPFSLGFPARWKKSDGAAAKNAGNFLDVANLSANNLPLEQLLVSWYDSRGTFAADSAAFPVLTEKYAAKYSDHETGIPSYRQISKGAVKLNGRDAYEFRFEGEAVDGDGAPIKIWGRTVFLPVGKEGATTGLTLTMLATSLEPALLGAQDLGEKGELAQVIKTFRFRE